ncbi:MAG TPA: PAS domain-containing protein, partial [Pseudorhizobium sp.]|nr:PAS domain-containing protein [Pseudorhizobium sp.]
MNLLFNLSPNPYVLLDSGLRIVGMNEAYLRATMRTEEAILGRSMFDAFPSDPESPSGKMLRQSFARVLDTGKIDQLSLIPYPIPGPDGVMEERYWSATNTPIKKAEGRIEFILQHTVDVTELHRLRQAADGNGDWKIQSAVLERADAVEGRNRALGEEREYLRNLFEQAPGFMAVLREPGHIFTIANKAYREMVG